MRDVPAEELRWREPFFSKAYKLLRGDPVDLPTAARKGRNRVMTRSMKILVRS